MKTLLHLWRPQRHLPQSLFCPKPYHSTIAASPSKTPTSASAPEPSILSRYLIDTFSFSQQRAVSASNRLPRITSVEKPESVVQFLQQFGFSDSQIRSIVLAEPQILFSNVGKVLKPKLEFFQQLGLTAADVGKIISQSPKLLISSLDRVLIPCVTVFKKIFSNDRDLVTVLRRSYRFSCRDAQSRLVSNISFLESSCKIVGSQLSSMLMRNPNFFVLQESVIREGVSRVLEMGFLAESRMFVHALYMVCGMTEETFSKKLQVFRSFGFSEGECMEIFRRSPLVFRSSEARLSVGIKFFLNLTGDVNFKRSMLVCHPSILGFSLEKRVIPRLRVIRALESKGLSKKKPSLLSVLTVTEKVFLERFVSKYRDASEILLMAYRGVLMDFSSQ